MSAAPLSLAGRRVLVTGASRGIGEATAAAFAAAGARVALVARSAEALEVVARRIGAESFPCDLADPEAVAGLLPRVEARGGPVDVLVNNCAAEVACAFDELTARELRDLLQVNLAAPMELARQAVTGMRARGAAGHVVNVSSVVGSVLFPGLTTYGATKAGLNQFTAMLRAEVAPVGVGVTLVELGPVQTGMLESVKRYGPTRASFERAYGLGLAVDVPAASVADAVVDAVRRRRPHLRLPRRSAFFPWLAALPRWASGVIFSGVPWRAPRALG